MPDVEESFSNHSSLEHHDQDVLRLGALRGFVHAFGLCEGEIKLWIHHGEFSASEKATAPQSVWTAIHLPDN